MAYKRISPLPINEGGTNTTSFATTDGTVYFDGTKLTTTATGTANQVLISQGGGGSPPVFSTVSAGNGTLMGAGGAGTIINSGTANQYCSLLSQNVNTVSPTNAATIWPIAGTISKLYVNINFSNTSGAATVTLMVNGSDTALTTTVTAGSTGNFTDLTHSVSINAGDALCFHTSGGSTGAAQGVITVKFQ